MPVQSHCARGFSLLKPKHDQESNFKAPDQTEEYFELEVVVEKEKELELIILTLWIGMEKIMEKENEMEWKYLKVVIENI